LLPDKVRACAYTIFINSLPVPTRDAQPPKLLTQVRERIRFHHYALSTVKAYLHWIRFFIRFSGLRHPNETGVMEVEAFLSHLANERQVSASTHKQALSAIFSLQGSTAR
jgi:Phage integrase, N-terminal SAM-like domain